MIHFEEQVLPVEIEAETRSEAIAITATPSIWSKARFFFFYVAVSSIIFVVLLGIMNFSAYIALAKTWIAPNSLQEQEQKIEELLGGSSDDVREQIAAYTQTSADRKIAEIRERNLKRVIEQNKIQTQKDWVSMNKIVDTKPEVHFPINVIPHDNRIIIPKIGKNIPIADVDAAKYENTDPSEWSDIFMDELANGVVQYPGTAKPGEYGNSFIFGHSSQLPWAKGEYNEAFALMDHLVYGDKIIVYFDQKQYTYVVRQKFVVKPGYVRALKQGSEKKLTLMTCWPVGTTLNRMLVVAELLE